MEKRSAYLIQEGFQLMPITSIDYAVDVIWWEQDSLYSNPKCIISTDTELKSKTILEYYSKRWEIETSFLYLKDRLGLKHYQMRKLKGLRRFWSIVYLAYTYLKLYRSKKSDQNTRITLGDVIKFIKRVTFKDLVKFVYTNSKNNISLLELCKILKIVG